MPGEDQTQNLEGPDSGQGPDESGEQGSAEPVQEPEDQKRPQPVSLKKPSEEEIKKYDLEIQGYESEQDIEDIDYSMGEN
jgi:hypothetical protein